MFLVGLSVEACRPPEGWHHCALVTALPCYGALEIVVFDWLIDWLVGGCKKVIQCVLGLDEEMMMMMQSDLQRLPVWWRLFYQCKVNIVVVLEFSVYCLVQVGQTRTCFNFVADRWYPVANTSIDHLIKIQEYAETGNTRAKSLSSRLALDQSNVEMR